MYQSATVLGYLGRDPESRFTQSGVAVTNFSVAAGEKWKDKSGEQKEHTEWFSCVAFGRTAEIASEYLRKGSMVLVTGRLRTEKWQDKEGNDRYTTKLNVDTIKLMPKGVAREEREPSDSPERSRAERASAPKGGQQEGKKQEQEEFDDDIPF